MRWVRGSQSSLGARLRTLLVLCVVVAVVAMVAESTLRSGAVPSRLNPGSPGMASGSVQPPPGEPEEPGLAAAKKQKGSKPHKDKQKADGKSKHKGDKPGKHKGDKPGKHKGDGKGKQKGDKQNSPKQKNTLRAAGAGSAASFPSVTVTPVADAKVSEASPNLNYGSSPQLLVDGGADPDVESYLRFDVAGVRPPVQQATLRLWVQPTGSTVDGPVVRATGASWSETGVTWSTRPTATSGDLDNTGKLTGSSWVEYNATAAVSGNGPVAFVLVPESNDGAVFDSRETANPPQLVITFGEETPSPTPTSTSTPTPSPTPTPTPTPTATPTPDRNARVVMAAGDNVCGASSGGSCKQMQTSDLLVAANPDAVLLLGDVQYECGEASDFISFYDPSWGRVKSITRPSVGNHEYRTSTVPGEDCFRNPPNAQAYFDYFGAAAGQVGQGYYSFDLGAWHLIALNSNCSKVGGCGVGSPQWDWLQNDLAAHPNSCTMAYWHAPLYSSGGRATTATKALYQALFDANADLVLTGHDHTYERFAPQNANTQVDNVRGIRQFVVGTGGRNLTSWGIPAANSEVKNNTTFGVLQLTLRPNAYDWQFVPIAGQSFTDGGSTACH